ncbi:PucR family transcriptional regulator [Nocardia concava]|uniref:PucR family transcriptional regulator n=1 Tax=Nocardia concava TaxID=257281 RepID=UPI000319525F|nr:helix-turn-helix domain-containing protein [Nocardia concava]
MAEAQKFIDAWHERAVALIANFAIGAPPYDVLPASMMDADFLPAAELNIELFFRFLRTGEEPSEADTEPLVARAVSLTRDGMPMVEALTNYRVGLTFVWNQVVGTPTAEEAVTAATSAFRLAQYVALMTSRIADACVDDVRQSRYDRIEQHRAIAEALLTGGDPYEWAEDAAVTLVDAYVVAVIRLGDAPPGILTELRRRLAGIAGSFLYRDSGGWTTLLPLRSAADERAAIDSLAEILRPKTRAAKPAIWVGVSAAPTRDGLPAAFAEARVLAETGRALRRPGMICRREDMVFEYAIATSGAAGNLVRVLDPLDGQPVLGETLEVFILQDFNQNGTARELSVHRNTVTYRLTRIAELTGYDPQTPAGISTLMSARVARQLNENGR